MKVLHIIVDHIHVLHILQGKGGRRNSDKPFQRFAVADSLTVQVDIHEIKKLMSLLEAT